MSRLENAMLLVERKADQRRRGIYTAILCLVIVLAWLASVFVSGSVMYANGLADGRIAERELHHPNNVKPVDVFRDLPPIEREIAKRWQKRLGAVGKEG